MATTSNPLSAPFTRRDIFRIAGVGALAATLGSACASEESNAPVSTGTAPEEKFTEPTTKLSGDLKILLWKHFVPSHDDWFDGFAAAWGAKVGVNVIIDHIDQKEIPARIAAEIQANSGHDLIEYIAPLASYEPSVIDMKDVTDEATKRFGPQLELCRKSSLNPFTNKFYAYSPGWVPDPGNYRKSLWEPVGFPNGPSTWDELLSGATEIKKSRNIPLGLGMSQEVDSNMVLRSLMWSFGASEQNAEGKISINSPETVAALDYMKKLYENTMTPEVFGWDAASNNQGLVAGQLSYIVNSISAWRTAQEKNPEIADDVYFTKALQGPKAALAAQHVLYNWIVPKFSTKADAAKEFLLHCTENYAAATYASKLYDLTGYPSRVPDQNTWLSDDPFGAKPADKLKVLVDAEPWSVNIGYPGGASAATGEVFGTFVIPNMFAKVAKGELSAKDAIADAEQQMVRIYDKWRANGLIS
ncbi:ABC transporter substrate-binding protein [Antrihabitans stalactiti]|uniref:ABC transporter substrate-binding protein n=1 Tax=Antrihabitans stalactiti TaxID=2584121 RepID=UPI0019819474|nr:extracellular solute-binding protein [Antrihabitans stalactiti]